MEKFEDVDYSEYKYKDYIWHENYREDKKRKKRSSVNTNQYKKEGKVRGKKRIIHMDKEGAFVVILIILSFSITFFLANFLGTDGTLKFLKSDEEYMSTYYAVAVDSFENEEYASVTADEIISLGCAGYIIHTDKYYLIASVYNDEDDAKTVANRISGYQKNVVEIPIKKPTLSWCKTADKDIVEEVLEYVKITFNSLYITVNSLDKNNISESVAFQQIKSLYNEINTLSSKLDKLSLSSSTEEVVKIRTEISATLALLKNIYEGDYVGNTLLSAIRFTQTAIVMGGKSLMEEI